MSLEAQVLPPNYVRSINFHNSTGVDATVHVSFESGAKETYTAKENSDLKVEKDIDHGTWQGVDPVVEFTVSHAGKESKVVSEDIKGV